MQVGQRRCVFKPEFKGGFASEGRGSSKSGEIGGCSTEFIPETGRGIASETHGASLIKQSMM
jgi:hypothetical protein